MKPPSERTRPQLSPDLFHDPDSDAPLAAMLNLLLARAGILGLPHFSLLAGGGLPTLGVFGHLALTARDV